MHCPLATLQVSDGHVATEKVPQAFAHESVEGTHWQLGSSEQLACVKWAYWQPDKQEPDAWRVQ